MLHWQQRSNCHAVLARMPALCPACTLFLRTYGCQWWSWPLSINVKAMCWPTAPIMGPWLATLPPCYTCSVMHLMRQVFGFEGCSKYGNLCLLRGRPCTLQIDACLPTVAFGFAWCSFLQLHLVTISSLVFRLVHVLRSPTPWDFLFGCLSLQDIVLAGTLKIALNHFCSGDARKISADPCHLKWALGIELGLSAPCLAQKLK